MKLLKSLLATLFIAMLLLSCDNSGSGGTNNNDDDTTIASINSITLLETDSGSGVKGLAADGASTVEIVIEISNIKNVNQLKISQAQSEDWGFFTTSNSKNEQSRELTIRSFDSQSKEVTLYLHSEQSLPSELADRSSAVIDYELTLVDNNGQSTHKSLPVEIIRTPVVFVHGLNSSRATFDTMLDYLRPEGLWLDKGLYALDYSTTATASYYTNRDVVPQAIDHTKSELLDLGYQTQKVILVGHSMGGNLTRQYLQDVRYSQRDDVLSVVTINTPHSGSQLADFGLALAAKYPSSALAFFGSMGAVVDLAVSSSATQNMNSSESLAFEAKVPTHVFTSTIGTIPNVADMIRDGIYLEAILVYLIDAKSEELIYGEPNDIVVPLSSQEGGIAAEYRTSYNDQWHTSVHTTQQCATDLLALISNPNASATQSKFTLEGFSPKTLNFDEETIEMPTIVDYNAELHAGDIANSIVLTPSLTGFVSAVKYLENGIDSSTSSSSLSLHFSRSKSKPNIIYYGFI